MAIQTVKRSYRNVRYNLEYGDAGVRFVILQNNFKSGWYSDESMCIQDAEELIESYLD